MVEAVHTGRWAPLSGGRARSAVLWAFAAQRDQMVCVTNYFENDKGERRSLGEPLWPDHVSNGHWGGCASMVPMIRLGCCTNLSDGVAINLMWCRLDCTLSTGRLAHHLTRRACSEGNSGRR